MFKILRIIFTILAVMGFASFFIIGIFLGWNWALIGIGIGLVFALLMLLMKDKQEEQGKKNTTTPFLEQNNDSKKQ